MLPGEYIFFACVDNNPQFIQIDPSCDFWFDSSCNDSLIYNVSSILDWQYPIEDNLTSSFAIIEEFLQVLEIAYNQSDFECNQNNNDLSITIDIGYSLYADIDIINSNEYGLICCRGYQSCSSANVIKTDFGGGILSVWVVNLAKIVVYCGRITV